jgi:hypothetical protein
MALLQRKTPEQRADDQALKDQRRGEADERKRLDGIEKERKAFFKTPAGRARLAFEADDHVFQYSIDVMSQQAIIVSMMGSATSRRTSDPVALLISVCREGLELFNGSFVFMEQGHQSRDKVMSSGQNVAIKGTTVGYYLFRRSEANRRDTGHPWENVATTDDVPLDD